MKYTDIIKTTAPAADAPARRKPRHQEESLQHLCVTWFRYQYPHLALLLFHPRNEHSEGRTRRIAIDASAGVVPGVPDLILAMPAWKHSDAQSLEMYHGLGIELKFGFTNRQTPAQARFQQMFEAAGYQYVLVRSLSQFQNTVADYLRRTFRNAEVLQAHGRLQAERERQEAEHMKKTVSE